MSKGDYLNYLLCFQNGVIINQTAVSNFPLKMNCVFLQLCPLKVSNPFNR